MARDVIVVGSGLAGMAAAMAARREGAHVWLVCRGPVGKGGNSILANGIFAGPTERYPLEAYVAETLSIGRFLNRRSHVERIGRGAAEATALLKEIGCPLDETRTHRLLRAPSLTGIPGITLMALLGRGLAAEGHVRLLPGVCVLDLLEEDGRIRGIRGVDLAGRALRLCGAPVILASGGGAAIYDRHDNSRYTLGHGYRLAARAGLSLYDMEFVQFFPVVLAEPGLPRLIAYPLFPAGTRLINDAGEEVLKKHGFEDINAGVVRKRDAFAALLHEELKRGPLYLDYRHFPAEAWERHPLSIFRHLAFDFMRRPVRVAPAAHFFMGGVRVDDDFRTEREGLYACGEMLWGLHGANRMGGNALLECVVSGMGAGEAAARRDGDEEGAVLAEETAGRDLDRGAYDSAREDLGRIAGAAAGIVRTAAGMQEGIRRLDAFEAALEDRLDGLTGRHAEDLRSGAFLLRTILAAGLARQESRGGFIRDDFPAEDPATPKNSRVQMTTGQGLAVTFCDAEN